ncbi:MAG: spinster family MFS transporter [Myxococcota bacterium]
MSAPPTPSATAASVTAGARRYALGILLVVYVFNFIDRQILTILLEDIKQELVLSDTALGFLTGIAFALFYTTLGIPIARWADRGTRRNIIALGLALWSGMTALSGAARSFTELAIARIGVGIGEAGCSPPAHSLLADYFPPEKRGRALSIYALGIPIGSAFGLFFGGWLAEFFGWRLALMAVGLPGLVLAVLVRWTLSEPPRGHSEGASADHGAGESVGSVLRFILRLRSFLHMAFAASLHAFVGYGAAAFLPVFLIRVHGMGQGEVGTWLAAIGLTAGALGTYLGGDVADRLGRRDPRWYLWVPGIATVLGLPFIACLYLWPDPHVALVLYSPAAVLGAMYLGPTFAMTQNLVKLRMRAVASAILLFIINLIGLGAGPQFVGYLSDRLRPVHDVESIRYALLFVVLIGSAWSALHYAFGARTLRRDLEASREDEAPAPLGA